MRVPWALQENVRNSEDSWGQLRSPASPGRGGCGVRGWIWCPDCPVPCSATAHPPTEDGGDRGAGGPRTSDRPAQNQQAGGAGAPRHPGEQLPHSDPGQEESRGRVCVILSAADKPRDDHRLADRRWRLRRTASVVWLQRLGSEYLTRLLRGLERGLKSPDSRTPDLTSGRVE